MDGQTVEWMDEWTGGWVEGWTDGRKHLICIVLFQISEVQKRSSESLGIWVRICYCLTSLLYTVTPSFLSYLDSFRIIR